MVKTLLKNFGLILLFAFFFAISVQAQYSSTGDISTSIYSYNNNSTETSGQAFCSFRKEHYYTINEYRYLYMDCDIDFGVERVSDSRAYIVELLILQSGEWKEAGHFYLDGGKYNNFKFTVYAKTLSNGDYTVRVALCSADDYTTGTVLASSDCILSIVDPVEWTVTYDYNGGTGNLASETITVGESPSLPTTVRAGYTFLGWYTEATGGEKFSDISNGTNVKIWGDYTLYAHWEANSYTVNFNANGGSSSTSSKKVTYGEAYGELPTPTLSGSIFDGWYTGSNSGSKVTSDTLVEIVASQTLYAHWITLKDQTISGSQTFTKAYKKGGTFQLNASANGALSYKSSDKSVVTVSSDGVVKIKGYGTAQITITAAATGYYKTTSKTITVKIKPSQMKLTSVKAGSGRTMQIRWKTDSKADGYQIQVSTTKKFKKSTTNSNSTSNNKNSKVTLKNLVKGKKYYVRIRAYKESDGMTIYGSWSKIKSVVVK